MLDAILKQINSNRACDQRVTFRLLEYFRFNQQIFQSVYQNIYNLHYTPDGILFYHKDSYYVH